MTASHGHSLPGPAGHGAQTVKQPPDAINPMCQDDALVQELLEGTSRTFAIAIPLLNSVRRRQIGLAYLLFRVADSIEDAPDADVAAKVKLLRALQSTMTQADGIPPDDIIRREFGALDQLWPAESATAQLLRDFPSLLRMLNTTDSAAAVAIRSALSSTIRGMTQFLDASRMSVVQIRIQTVRDLQSYCYVVAGIVGEMLTDLFVSHHPVPSPIARELRLLSVGFGECLQLTNILKDSEGDLLDGRVFIPADTSREVVINLAMNATGVAKGYIRLLEENEFPADIVAFCRFLCLLAEGTLNRIQSTPDTNKLTREEVSQMLRIVQFPATEASLG